MSRPFNKIDVLDIHTFDRYFLAAGVELNPDGAQGDERSDKFKDEDDGLL